MAFQNATLANFNQTLLNNSALCTLSTCPLVLDSLPLAHLDYLPSVTGNAAFAAIFGVFIVGQVLFGVYYRTWGYLVGTFCGLLLEIVGYTGRILMHSNPFIDAHFVMYLSSLTIAPAFLSASIYLCLSHIVVIYSENSARFKPRTYTIFFVFCDLVSLTLQGAGGGVAATAATPSMDVTGKDLLIAGLVFQVASLLVFAACCLDLRLRYRSAVMNQSFAELRRKPQFIFWLWCLAGAWFFIFVRSVYRVAELSSGFHSSLANNQVTFMILEGTMIILATGALTTVHPGFALGKHRWSDSDWSAAGKKRSDEVKVEA